MEGSETFELHPRGKSACELVRAVPPRTARNCAASTLVRAVSPGLGPGRRQEEDGAGQRVIRITGVARRPAPRRPAPRRRTLHRGVLSTVSCLSCPLHCLVGGWAAEAEGGRPRWPTDATPSSCAALPRHCQALGHCALALSERRAHGVYRRETSPDFDTLLSCCARRGTRRWMVGETKMQFPLSPRQFQCTGGAGRGGAQIHVEHGCTACGLAREHMRRAISLTRPPRVLDDVSFGSGCGRG